jgi:NhaP-type Na+/H+ or K+/H+ antiporter
MSSFSKFWLGVFTFLPLLLTIAMISVFFAVFFDNIIMADHYGTEFPFDHAYGLFWFIIIIVLLAMVSLGVRIYYIVHTNNLPGNDTAKKIMWTLILIFVGLIGSIVYYFIEILPLKKQEVKE